MVLADCLEDIGKERRAEAFRWLAHTNRWPEPYERLFRPNWYRWVHAVNSRACLPVCIMQRSVLLTYTAPDVRKCLKWFVNHWMGLSEKRRQELWSWQPGQNSNR